jgi:CO/xanthine dehydrogenase Mo-binding subunit
VRFVGEEIAAVAADTEQAAQAAVRAIKVQYEKYLPSSNPKRRCSPLRPN